MSGVRRVLLSVAVFTIALAGTANSARNPSCTYFGHTFCLRLKPLSKVNYSFGPDFFVHHVLLVHDITKRESTYFAIYEGEHPRVDYEKCVFSETGDYGRTVEACSYAGDDRVDFAFRVNPETEDQHLPTLMHVWFPDSGDQDSAVRTLKKTLIIE